MKVSVALALPQEQWIHDLELPEGATAWEAVLQSGLLPDASAGEPNVRVGIYGRIASGSAILKEGDRVEIYRTLKADPKEARRRKANSRHRKSKG